MSLSAGVKMNPLAGAAEILFLILHLMVLVLQSIRINISPDAAQTAACRG
jgi:hypothetical protein